MGSTHTVWVEIDPRGVIPESKEENNQQVLEISLETDLGLRMLCFVSPVPSFEGGGVTVAATAIVDNVGSVDVSKGMIPLYFTAC